MKSQLTSFISLVALCACPSLNALAQNNQLSLKIEKSISSDEQPFVDRLKQDDALPELVSFINETVPLAEPLLLRIGADDGPLFDPNINEIWVPGAFLVEINQRFVDAKLAQTIEERNNVVMDVFTHTLLHEVGHAIIAQFDIPTLGKEEDAADNLATILMLDYLEDGDTMALNAADMFALEDQDVDMFYSEDFWDEHSLDIQRYYSMICQVYGARPDDNVALLEDGELSEDKAESCIDEYEQISANWTMVLESLQNP